MDLLDLMVKIGVEDEATSKIDSISGKIKGGLGTVAKAGAAALAAATTAAVAGGAAIIKSSMDAYASFEQLTGGVETLFKDSAVIVEDYASNAYRTAGMSANQYMETVTSFSASLLQSLGGDTVAAAQYADMAVTDMSDNANKMGTNIQSLQDAYSGFAKQNFTMLDNLKLGYGGTKEEMQRLIDDANRLREAQGLNADLTIDSYADIVEAIHTVQTEMDITGTTAKEASTTIEGSVKAAKAAWENWITGLADSNADMTDLTEQLVDSVITAASNIIPRLMQIMTALGTALTEQLPYIFSSLVGIIETYGPGFGEAAMNMFMAILTALVEFAPQAVAGLVTLLVDLVNHIADNLPAILSAAIDMFMGVLTALLQLTPQILAALVNLLVSLVAAVIGKVGDMLGAAVQLIGGVISGIGSQAGNVVSSIKNVISQLPGAVVSFVGQMTSAAGNLIQGIVAGLDPGAVIGKIRSICASAVDAIKSFFGIHSPSKVMERLFAYNMEGAALGIEKNEDKVVDSMQDMVDSVYDVAGNVKVGIAAGAGSQGGFTFGDITINAVDRTMDEVFDEIIRYATNARRMRVVNSFG